MASLTAVLSALHQAVGNSSRTTGAMKEAAEMLNPLGNPVNGELRQALVEVADDRRGSIDAKRLGHFLGRHQGRIVAGLKIVAAEDDSHAKQRRWRVVQG